ncbi:MAG TPA: DUF2162 domain-containing protein [Bacillota bacterium]|nr:DUF2162 domain-containing protein [Bacillota bacterium]
MFLLHGGLLTATLILSIKTGLVLGASRLGAGALILAAAGLGGGLFLLTAAFAGRQQLLVDMLDRYTFTGALLIALTLICLGLQEPASAGPKSAGGRGRLSYLLGFLPCPFCMIALAFSVIVMAPLLGAGVPALGSGTAAVFTLLAIAAAFAGRKLIGAVQWNPTAVFNHLLFFTGVLTLAFALTIPNFVQAMAMPSCPIAIASPRWLGLVLLGFGSLSLFGYVQNKAKFAKGRDHR